MWGLQPNGDPETYLNPVYSRSFPDPFVLKFRAEYFAYCTGFAEDGNVFGILHSRDLVTWNELGGAMRPLDNSPPYYWAPEVTYDNGKFYLYYSVGNETLMELRVAVSDRPDGGFVDSGNRLTHEDFAIDAHVFIDDNGAKYLFYATDFLEHTHIGTGTVVDRMIDWFTLEGDPRPVTRAKFDWQVYDPHREEKGGVRWHTVEGPTILKRKGRYYEMFSGGNWQNTTYGVSYATSDRIDNPEEWQQLSDGEKVLPILRTIPERIIGPGHNSVVVGPNERELYCVYHRWTDEGRVMAIDRMDFAGDRIFIVGPSYAPQPMPFMPTNQPSVFPPAKWNTTGTWSLADGIVTSTDEELAELTFTDPPQSYLCSLTLRCDALPRDDGRIALLIVSDGESLRLTFHPASNTVRIEVPTNSTGLPSIFKLPEEFDWTKDHHLRIEVDCRRVKIKVDAAALNVNLFLGAPAKALSIVSKHQPVAIGPITVTEGFEELFETAAPLAENAWRISGENFRLESSELRLDGNATFSLSKGDAEVSFEFAANFRTLERDSTTGEFGLAFFDGTAEAFRIAINCSRRQIDIGNEDAVKLAESTVLSEYHQLRVIRLGDRALCYLDDVLVRELNVGSMPLSCSVFSDRVGTAIDMIRLTRI